MKYQRKFILAILVVVVVVVVVVVLLQFQLKNRNGTGLKLCTQVGYHDGSCNGMLFF